MPRKNNKGRVRPKDKTYQCKRIERDLAKNKPIESKEIVNPKVDALEMPDMNVKEEELKENNCMEGLSTFCIIIAALALLIEVFNLLK